MIEPPRMHPEDLERLAKLIAAELRDAPPSPTPKTGLLNVNQAAEILGTSTAYVRRHAVEFGGRRLGNGSRARWRFPVEELQRAHAAPEAEPMSPAPLPHRRRRRRHMANATSGEVELLP